MQRSGLLRGSSFAKSWFQCVSTNASAGFASRLGEAHPFPDSCKWGDFCSQLLFGGVEKAKGSSASSRKAPSRLRLVNPEVEPKDA